MIGCQCCPIHCAWSASVFGCRGGSPSRSAAAGTSSSSLQCVRCSTSVVYFAFQYMFQTSLQVQLYVSMSMFMVIYLPCNMQPVTAMGCKVHHRNEVPCTPVDVNPTELCDLRCTPTQPCIQPQPSCLCTVGGEEHVAVAHLVRACDEGLHGHAWAPVLNFLVYLMNQLHMSKQGSVEEVLGTDAAPSFMCVQSAVMHGRMAMCS